MVPYIYVLAMSESEILESFVHYSAGAFARGAEVSRMRLHLMLELPPPVPQKQESEPTRMSLEDKVRDALELIDSGYESRVEWLMINKLYHELCKRKPTPRVQNLKKMIKPVLAKFGYHDVTTEK